MSEANKALVRQVFELNNQHDLDKLGELIAPNHLLHFAGSPPMDWEGHKNLLAMFYAAFPDFHITLEDLIAEGDKVVVRMTARGTHKDAFQGIGATGKAITVTGITIQHIVGSKVGEEWINVDALGLMQQLGVIPASGQG